MAGTKKNGNGQSFSELGRNVKYNVTGKTLTLSIDLGKKGKVSSSGKSTIIASSQGNQPIAYEGEILKLGLNVYQPV